MPKPQKKYVIDLKKSDFRFVVIILIIPISLLGCNSVSRNTEADWIQLLGDNVHLNWDVYMGAPHATVKNLNDVDPNSDGRNSKALGLNNDPKNVFSFTKFGNEPVLHISGEIYGSITSKNEFDNYHLRLKFKWGEQKWEPRLNKLRDSGILYHCIGEHGAFWNVWMASQEFQVQETECGDYYGLVSTLIDIPSDERTEGKDRIYNKNADLLEYSALNKFPPNHCDKGFDNESTHGEWNTLELICLGDTSLHIVNGKVVMALFNSRHINAENEIEPLRKGRIQIQSEGAEIYYKNIELRTISDIPENFKKQI